MRDRARKGIVGFTLLEVLIALVVLSIGLIGMAALLVQGQKFNRYALNQTQASFLAYDMADRVRANIEGARAGSYDDDTAQDNNCVEVTGTAATACSPAQMAQHDVFEWRAQIGQLLPRRADSTPAIGNVTTRPATATDPLGIFITVTWGEIDPNNPNANSDGLADRVTTLKIQP